MRNFLPYLPEQGELLPRDVRTELGEDHVCFLIHEMVESWDLSEFVEAYSEHGGESAYHPSLMLKVWLYAYALKVKSTRKLEQRIKEDLGFRFLAGQARPDHKTLNNFFNRHREAIQGLFVQATRMLRELGLVRFGTMAIDSTRIKANASREKHVLRQRDLEEKFLEWQKQVDEDPNSAPGMSVGAEQMEQVRAYLKRLQAAGESKLSLTDPDARFLRQHEGGFIMGYTAEMSVSEDHFIAAVNVSQSKSDNAALIPMVDKLEQDYGQRPECVMADTGFFSSHNLEEMDKRNIDTYLPDSNMARELKRGASAEEQKPTRDARMLRMREKLRSPHGRLRYRQRRCLVEPIFGVLKQQRGMREFQRRGLAKVAAEFTMAALAFNLTRFHNLRKSTR
jgi:transposase